MQVLRYVPSSHNLCTTTYIDIDSTERIRMIKSLTPVDSVPNLSPLRLKIVRPNFSNSITRRVENDRLDAAMTFGVRKAVSHAHICDRVWIEGRTSGWCLDVRLIALRRMLWTTSAIPSHELCGDTVMHRTTHQRDVADQSQYDPTPSTTKHPAESSYPSESSPHVLDAWCLRIPLERGAQGLAKCILSAYTSGWL